MKKKSLDHKGLRALIGANGSESGPMSEDSGQDDGYAASESYGVDADNYVGPADNMTADQIPGFLPDLSSLLPKSQSNISPGIVSPPSPLFQPPPSNDPPPVFSQSPAAPQAPRSTPGSASNVFDTSAPTYAAPKLTLSKNMMLGGAAALALALLGFVYLSKPKKKHSR